MGAAMTRFDSNLYLTGLMMVALLLLGLMVVRSVGPAEKGGRAHTLCPNTARFASTPLLRTAELSRILVSQT